MRHRERDSRAALTGEGATSKDHPDAGRFDKACLDVAAVGEANGISGNSRIDRFKPMAIFRKPLIERVLEDLRKQITGAGAAGPY